MKIVYLFFLNAVVAITLNAIDDGSANYYKLTDVLQKHLEPVKSTIHAYSLINLIDQPECYTVSDYFFDAPICTISKCGTTYPFVLKNEGFFTLKKTLLCLPTNQISHTVFTEVNVVVPEKYINITVPLYSRFSNTIKNFNSFVRISKTPNFRVLCNSQNICTVTSTFCMNSLFKHGSEKDILPENFRFSFINNRIKVVHHQYNCVYDLIPLKQLFYTFPFNFEFSDNLSEYFQMRPFIPPSKIEFVPNSANPILLADNVVTYALCKNFTSCPQQYYSPPLPTIYNIDISHISFFSSVVHILFFELKKIFTYLFTSIFLPIFDYCFTVFNHYHFIDAAFILVISRTFLPTYHSILLSVVYYILKFLLI